MGTTIRANLRMATLMDLELIIIIVKNIQVISKMELEMD